MQLVPNIGKHAISAQCEKTCNQCQALENLQPSPNVGKHAIGAKCGKTCNCCQLWATCNWWQGKMNKIIRLWQLHFKLMFLNQILWVWQVLLIYWCRLLPFFQTNERFKKKPGQSEQRGAKSFGKVPFKQRWTSKVCQAPSLHSSYKYMQVA